MLRRRGSLRHNTDRVYDGWVPLSGRTKNVANSVLALIFSRDISILRVQTQETTVEGNDIYTS
jgi:hypothetical protein